MISIEELKKSIENKVYNSDSLLIFLTQGSNFIALQYINEISEIVHKKVEVVDELVHDSSFSLFLDNTETLKLCFVDKLTTDVCNVSDKNCFVICNSVDKECSDIFDSFIVKTPKLESWQVKEYMYSNCSGTSEKFLDWLAEFYKYDIFRINSEISKINIFDETQRNYLFEEFVNSGVFEGASRYTIFDLTDAIIKHDSKSLCLIYKDIKNIDIEPLGLVSILLKNFRNVIDIQLAKNPTAESCGMSGKQFYAISKYSCNHYSKEQLVEIYRMLLSIDKMLKTGYISESVIVDYIITFIFDLT